MSRIPDPGVIAPGVDADGPTAALAGRPRPGMSGLTGQDSWLSQNRALLIPYGLILILLAAAAIRAPGFVSGSNMENPRYHTPHCFVIAAAPS